MKIYGELKKKYGIYHWDTFDNETFLVDQTDTLEEAQAKVQEYYKGRIIPHGADKVEIITNNGDVVIRYSVQ